jgi:hypothetical protein
MSKEFEDELGVVLRHVTDSVLPDKPLRLVYEAHARGRRTRRRRNVVVSGAAALTLVAVGGAVVATSGTGDHGRSQVVQGSGIAVPQSADTVTRMKNAMTALLKPGALTFTDVWDADKGQVEVMARFTNSRGTAYLEVRVTRYPAGTNIGKAVCPEAIDPTAPCSLSPWKGGQVNVYQSLFPAPADWLTGEYSTERFSVMVSQDWGPGGAGPRPKKPPTAAPLTAAQLTTIVKSDVWRDIATAMPPSSTLSRLASALATPRSSSPSAGTTR